MDAEIRKEPESMEDAISMIRDGNHQKLLVLYETPDGRLGIMMRDATSEFIRMAVAGLSIHFPEPFGLDAPPMNRAERRRLGRR